MSDAKQNQDGPAPVHLLVGFDEIQLSNTSTGTKLSQPLVTYSLDFPQVIPKKPRRVKFMKGQGHDHFYRSPGRR
jgi:hypothetical protein